MDLVDHLSEVNRRLLHLAWGFGSLWDYCTRELLLKDGVAHPRITLAKLVGKKPAVRDHVREGRLGPCAACLLLEFVEAPDFDDLLLASLGMSKRVLQDHLMSRRTGPNPVRDTIRRVVPEPSARFERTDPVTSTSNPGTASQTPETSKPSGETATESIEQDIGHTESTVDPSSGNANASSTPPPKAKTHRISFLAAEELVEKLQRARDLESCQDLSLVIGKALDLYLDKKDPRKRQQRRNARKAKMAEMAKAKERRKAAGKATETPVTDQGDSDAAGSRSDAGAAHPRRPPAAVRDETRLADGERCTYTADDGTRCEARRHLQADHIWPYALGGSSVDSANIRCLCSAHNRFVAKDVFGMGVPASSPSAFEVRSKQPVPKEANFIV